MNRTVMAFSAGGLLLMAACSTDPTEPREVAAALSRPQVASSCSGGSGTSFGSAPSLSGSITSGGRPQLAWSAVAGASYYKVFVRYTPAGPAWETIASNLTSTTFTDVTKVLPGTGTPRFEYQVIAYQQVFCGGYLFTSPASNIVSFRADPKSGF